MLLKYYVFLPRVLSLKVDGIPLSNSLFYYESLELLFFIVCQLLAKPIQYQDLIQSLDYTKLTQTYNQEQNTFP